MAEYVKIELGRTSNEYEFHIVCSETRREVENARLREENDSLKLQVTQLRLRNERPETCPVCHNQLRNSPKNDGAAMRPQPRL
jgi:DNA repair exonuclease SbcCD ATPase subunit